MCKFTRKQIVFLIVYPIGHCVLSIILLLMAISSTGIGPPDTGDPPITLQQEIVSKVGAFSILILWAPIFLVEKMFKLPHGPFQDYLWIFLAGLLYAVIALGIYKAIYRK